MCLVLFSFLMIQFKSLFQIEFQSLFINFLNFIFIIKFKTETYINAALICFVNKPIQTIS